MQCLEGYFHQYPEWEGDMIAENQKYDMKS